MDANIYSYIFRGTDNTMMNPKTPDDISALKLALEEYNNWPPSNREKYYPIIEAAAKRYVEIESMLEWRPIETAPRDGTKFLAILPDHPIPEILNAVTIMRTVGDKDDVYIGFVRGSDFFSEFENVDELYPTHWMPLPNPPATRIGNVLTEGK